ncbi:MAG: efflux transporter outer membrane subunit [Nitrospinae bacterium]|nr:efflux transporter outer membrane subunit [Nitrospinota bacterium]
MSDLFAVKDGELFFKEGVPGLSQQILCLPAVITLFILGCGGIKMAVERIREADMYARIAGATLLPVVDASAGISRIRQVPGQFTPCTKERTADCYTASLSASYEIDFWGKNASASESALALAQSSRLDQLIVTLTITADVATAYFSIVGLRDRLAIARNNLENANHLQGNIQRRFDHGLATALDLAQQKRIVANFLSAIPPLELKLRQQTNALAILVGQMPGSLHIQEETGGISGIASPAVTPGLPSELLERRPDIQSAEARLIAANADINKACAALFPSISLTMVGGFASTALSSLLLPESAFFSLGSSLLQPIFRGEALAGELKYREARYNELLHEFHKTVIAAFSDVENALAATTQTLAEENARQEVGQEAKNAYELSQKRFDAGLIDIDTTLNAERTLFSANDALIQAKLSHLQALVSLSKALGGGWRN